MANALSLLVRTLCAMARVVWEVNACAIYV